MKYILSLIAIIDKLQDDLEKAPTSQHVLMIEHELDKEFARFGRVMYGERDRIKP